MNKSELIRLVVGLLYISAVFALYHFAPAWVAISFVGIVGLALVWFTRKR